MIDDLAGINFFFPKDPVIRRQDKIWAGEGFNYFRVVPFGRFHLKPVHVFYTIRTGFYIAKLAGCYRITNPEYELAILVVCDFCCVHPEATDGYGTVTGAKCIGWVLIAGSHMECSLRYVYHARRLWH